MFCGVRRCFGGMSYFGVSFELTEERVDTRRESLAGMAGPLLLDEDPVELPLLIDMDRMEGPIDETADIFLL